MSASTERHNPYEPYESGPEPGEMVLPKIRYTIPTQWGAIYVSETAHRNWGLKPLSLTNSGLRENRIDRALKTNIFIVGGEELGSSYIDTDSPFSLNTYVVTNGIDVVCNPGMPIDESGIIINREDDPDEVNNYFHLFLHGLGEQLSIDITEAAKTWNRHRMGRDAYRRLGLEAILSTAVAGASIFVGSETHKPLISMAGSGLGLAYYAVKNHLLVGRRLLMPNGAEAELEDDANEYACEIAEDLHVSFCMGGFEKRLKDSTELDSRERDAFLLRTDINDTN